MNTQSNFNKFKDDVIMFNELPEIVGGIEIPASLLFIEDEDEEQEISENLLRTSPKS